MTVVGINSKLIAEALVGARNRNKELKNYCLEHNIKYDYLSNRSIKQKLIKKMVGLQFF